jgi:hypothetical protein
VELRAQGERPEVDEHELAGREGERPLEGFHDDLGHELVQPVHSDDPQRTARLVKVENSPLKRGSSGAVRAQRTSGSAHSTTSTSGPGTAADLMRASTPTSRVLLDGASRLHVISETIRAV